MIVAKLASDTTTSTSKKRVGILGDQPTIVFAIDNRKAAAPSGKGIVYGKQVLFYYCNNFNNYGLCQGCHDKKQKAGEVTNGILQKKKRQRGTRKGVVTNTDVCDHSTIHLLSQHNKRYLPRLRKPNT